MKVSSLEILQHPWLTKKRKVMLGILVAFVAASSLYKVSQTGADNIGASSYASHPSHVRTGGWLCEDAYSAYNRSLLNVSVPKCYQIGDDMAVNILDRASFGRYEVIKVGNRNGVAWAASADVAE